MRSYVCSQIFFCGLLCVTVSRGFRSAVAFRNAYRNLLLVSRHFLDTNVTMFNDNCRNARCLAHCDPRSLGGTSNTLEPNEITVANEQKDFPVDEELIYDTCQMYRSMLGVDDFSVDILFVTSETMRDANKETFGKDRPTDSISHADNSKYIRQEYHLNRSPMQVPEFRHLGEIMLCPDYIHKQMMADTQMHEESPEDGPDKNMKEPVGVARRLKGVTDLNLRICFLLAHGFLHLLGYDHVTDSDFEEMLRQEDKLLDAFVRHYGAKQPKKHSGL